MTGLGIPRPSIIRTCPPIWEPPTPRPDLIRESLGIPPSTAVVLYQGQFVVERGIEQSMTAILDVPDAVLVLLGFGALQEPLERQIARAPWQGRVFLLPPVAPDDLLSWTASADVSVMAIQGTTENHRHTTPQKLFESIAAGVPVVASDLPGFAGIIEGTSIGILCDPASPASIATAIRTILDEPAADRTARREAILRIARERYNWEAQVETLFAVYASLAPVSAGSGAPRS
jgi:glycosyltransferase involved in cell wall biosynthesis